jgi:hypothetical protein
MTVEWISHRALPVRLEGEQSDIDAVFREIDGGDRLAELREYADKHDVEIEIP